MLRKRIRRGKKKVRRYFKRLRRVKVPYYLDCAVAPFIDPGQTLVVSGFWRSGTTWLQQSLASILRAKTVFEPFGVYATTGHRIHSHGQLADRKAPFRDLYMPHCSGRLLAKGPLRDAFRRALQGNIPGRWVRRLRGGVAEALRARIVVKMIRGHLSLWAGQNTFAMPLIHIYRDPRAVVASIRMTAWEKLFDYLFLREQLLDFEDGRADFFGQWRSEILEYDRQGRSARIAAYWALTERYLRDCGWEEGASVCFVSFEELCLRPETALASIRRDLGKDGLASLPLDVLSRDSDTTSEQRRNLSPEERVAGWKKILSRSESQMIEEIATRFGFEDRLVS